ncbi:hypothetical protein E7Z59_13430 [Robertkochia marina]|uniref:Right handed beta helix domain-containing protein n=1 Tax=Robertkochia marina TaxID=1227945 RepID=A0A4V3UY14_9FLAO|nr:right-handed parallel beta-helix repeat-containing protein [Robertkochia marina]THD66774.1 hypothetical protein E7Z59_13430 [Robertkochia marina]TRZ41935.1 hypothetical protein D3A96_12650 [Robertkochia marina]
MRVLTYFMYFSKAFSTFLMISFLLSSCSDDITDDLLNNDNFPEEQSPDTNVDPPEEIGEINNQICDFDFSSLDPGDTFLVDCTIDLNGDVVNLPQNLTLDFDGGQIINGVLNFDGGKISGKLLNYRLGIEGSAQLIEEEAVLYKERWNLIEGPVSKEIAQNNTVMIKSFLKQLELLNASILLAFDLDIYLNSENRYQVPFDLYSNFTLFMNEQTFLRAFPGSGNHSTLLIRVLDAENVKVSGGNLIGERNEHETQENYYGNLLKVKSGVNVLIENTVMKYAGSDGITIESSLHPYEAGYIPSRNVVVQNCVFDSCKRNNLSITDGEEIVVQGCTFLNAGVDLSNSKGEAPRYGIVIEPFVNNAEQPWQRVQGVKIINNVERGSAAGGLVAADGDDILVSGNQFEKRVAITAASNVTIENNDLNSSILAGLLNSWYSSHRMKNTVISGNTINNTGVGISATQKDIKIFDNVIKNCGVGIQLRALKDSEVYQNTIISEGNKGDGINALDYLDNVLIHDNVVDVDDYGHFFDGVNWDDAHDQYSFEIRNNNVQAGNMSQFKYTRGMSLVQNDYVNGIKLLASRNILLSENEIDAQSPFSIEIASYLCNNIKISDNIINNSDTGRNGSGIICSGFGYGENKFIEIRGNIFNVKGYNNGIRLEGINEVIVENNSGTIESGPLIYFRGDNSRFINNQTLNSDIQNDIVGQNNLIE